jgi:predicted amidohydrolase YtcJ
VSARARIGGRAAEIVVIRGGRLLTGDPARPIADAALVADGVFASVGDPLAAATAARRGARVVELDGRVGLPGFVDPHVHVLATAAASLSADCSPPRADSIAAIVGQLRRHAGDSGETWARGMGYDETALREGRHPTRGELDAAFPDRPVVLKHGSGHALVLNSRAWAELGMAPADRGDGLVTDREPPLPLPRLPFRQLGAACARVSREWRRRGITQVGDLGADNRAEEVAAIHRLRAKGFLSQEVTVFWDAEDLAGLDAYRDRPLPVAGAKLVLDERHLDGGSCERLAALIGETHRRGLILAVHVVDLPCLAVALDALDRARAQGAPGSHVRLEHVSLCPPALVPRLRASGAMVVTQPLFRIDRARRYRVAVPEEMHPWLYPIEALLGAGVPIACSSDSPVGDADPLRAIASLGARAIAEQGRWTRAERLAAIKLHTSGSLAPGRRADLIALSVDPLLATPDELAAAEVAPILDPPEPLEQPMHGAQAA